MWGFLSDVRESVRQVVAPPPGAASSNGNSGGGTSGAANASRIEETVSGLTAQLFRLWGRVNSTASHALHEAFDEAVPLREESVPPLFTLSAEQRAVLSTEELLSLLADGVRQTADRARCALDEASFLLDLSIEEQIAHTDDYVACYEWWDRAVNRRLLTCQGIIQTRLTPSETSAEQGVIVARLARQMEAIWRDSTQPMAAVAARGRLLKDERYDLLRSLPATFQAEAEPTAKSAGLGHSNVDSAITAAAAAAPPKPYVPQFKPFDAQAVPRDPTAPLPASLQMATSTTAPPVDGERNEGDHQSVAAAAPSASVQPREAAEEQARIERAAAEEQARI
ncbi:Membrane associated protein-like protein, partial [Leptomonas pyrrhocoris]